MIKIPVVEDDENLNKVVCSWLNSSGFAARGCLNGEDACEEMYNNIYEMIISDIMMPRVDRFEFAQTGRSG